MTPQRFRKIILDFYRGHRRDFPWRKTRDPYRILVSEIMLQQTQVDRVIPKYLAFLTAFPTLAALAKAPTAKVLTMWQGLGYNRRALSLKKLSEIVMREHKGRLPKDPAELVKLPGIGRYTAGAVAAFAWNMPVLCIETNIRRVYLHHFFKGKENVADEAIYPLLQKTVDRKNPRRWYSALMDYGTHLAKNVQNPNKRSKHYALQAKFEGSNRQLRGRILQLLVNHKRASLAALRKHLAEPPERISAALQALEKEGFIRSQQDFVSLS